MLCTKPAKSAHFHVPALCLASLLAASRMRASQAPAGRACRASRPAAPCSATRISTGNDLPLPGVVGRHEVGLAGRKRLNSGDVGAIFHHGPSAAVGRARSRRSRRPPLVRVIACGSRSRAAYACSSIAHHLGAVLLRPDHARRGSARRHHPTWRCRIRWACGEYLWRRPRRSGLVGFLGCASA